MKVNLNEKINKFCKWEERLSAYRMALTLIGIDQTAGAPSSGADYRDSRAALLQGEFRRVLYDDEIFGIIGELLGEPEGALIEEACRNDLDEGDLRRMLQLYHDQLVKERSVPPDEYSAFARVLDRSKLQWLRAKKEEDFKGYAPYLQEVIDGYRHLTALQNSSLGIYDRMLDDMQPGWIQAKYDVFFGHVKERILPLLDEIKKKETPDRSFIGCGYDAEPQRRVMKQVLELIGFTPDWGRISESEHPLTTCISRGDVRFTTKYRPDDPSAAVLSSVHESGHAWFGHNVDEKYDGTVIARSISAGLHESQSRFCENHLGRSRAFWDVIYPLIRKEFPEKLSGIDTDTFYKGINAVRPSLIRTKSDEVTYPLHILIRYELEKEMMEGDLRVKDLEDAWSDRYDKYLGIRPSVPSEGVLQDMHWPYAYFGYFPTYALGSAMAAQFFNAATKDLEPEKLIREGRYTEIMIWLRDHVHRYAGRYEADEILKLATGETFNDEYYFRWLENKYR